MGERYEITEASVAAHMASLPKTGSGVQLPRRCPGCGWWLSTRYSAGMPHVCEAVQDRADLQTPLVVKATPGLLAAVGEAKATHRPKLEPVHDVGCRLRWRHCLHCTCQPPFPLSEPPAAPAGALNPTAPTSATPARQSAPAPRLWPWWAMVLAWVAGYLSAALVGLLVWALL